MSYMWTYICGIGDTIVSSDADGGVRLWDVRMVQERLNIDAGPHAANKVCMGVWVYGCMCM